MAARGLDLVTFMVCVCVGVWFSVKSHRPGDAWGGAPLPGPPAAQPEVPSLRPKPLNSSRWSRLMWSLCLLPPCAPPNLSS